MDKYTFYHSGAWRRLSKAFLLSKSYICERCGQPGEIAHHKIYLTQGNIDNPNIALNPDNLECLCKACHNNEHFGKGDAVAIGVMFDKDGNIIPAGDYREGGI